MHLPGWKCTLVLLRPLENIIIHGVIIVKLLLPHQWLLDCLYAVKLLLPHQCFLKCIYVVRNTSYTIKRCMNSAVPNVDYIFCMTFSNPLLLLTKNHIISNGLCALLFLSKFFP